MLIVLKSVFCLEYFKYNVDRSHHQVTLNFNV